ncbi:hypothetical protein CERZMDRAFT_98883 [Cercospora zeae-maydis SCOH1-5]|uniref:Uncharacterized protein n=1 Tax=Cercospora zeae-maydis SCOH1-5 TaxID=717836 RepID=A0A6A6FCL7_9PEZI|nr:hypothetical protein CERZMDRAFT_98883 [Cercospora zeae-maydis SCOH1-5]
MHSQVDLAAPSEASMARVDRLPVTALKLEDFNRPSCVKSIITKSNGHFIYQVVFGGSCSGWEGRVRVPEGDASVEIRRAWNAHAANHQPYSQVSPMQFTVNPRNPFACISTVGRIVEAGQKAHGGTLWYKRKLQIGIEEHLYDGHVYVRRTDTRMLEEIKIAKVSMAHDFDDERLAAEAVDSIEEIPEMVTEKKTFDFTSYPQRGRRAEVSADDVHGNDLWKYRVAVTEVKKVGSLRNVKFRLLLPNDQEVWYEGTLEDDMKRGRFEEVGP